MGNLSNNFFKEMMIYRSCVKIWKTYPTIYRGRDWKTHPSYAGRVNSTFHYFCSLCSFCSCCVCLSATNVEAWLRENPSLEEMINPPGWWKVIGERPDARCWDLGSFVQIHYGPGVVNDDVWYRLRHCKPSCIIYTLCPQKTDFSPPILS